MTIADFFEYLLARQETRDLAEELVSAYDLQHATRVRTGSGR
jgi:hypothetical protein